MRQQTCNGFTRLELFYVVLAVAVLGFVSLVLTFSARRPRDGRFWCVTNLKQIGLGFRMWSNDHGEKFPWEVSTNDGGTLQYADSVDVWRHFQAVSNELRWFKRLACPADLSRHYSTEWNGLRNTNISYFISMSTGPAKPARVLAGDRFVSTNNNVASGLLMTTNSQLLRWVRGGHEKAGNVVFIDGSANQWSTDDLRAAFSNQAVRLAIP